MNLHPPLFRRGGTGYAGMGPAAPAPQKVKRPVPDVREGDEWVFTTNHGQIVRRVVMVGTDRIGYTRPGSSRMLACLKTTFYRWARCASLEFATDWGDREP